MADWQIIADLGTSIGTLVLAAATFASVRSANRTAKIAEEALKVGLRPVLTASRPEDRTEKVVWLDDHWTHLDGGRSYAEVTENGIYLAISLRNVGNGLAVLHGWATVPRRAMSPDPHLPVEDFRPQSRDIYVPAADITYWHGAYRDDDLAANAELASLIEERLPFTIELLYGDHDGGQRTITRFNLQPRGEKGWMTAVTKHWNLDRDDPR
jgi:hypothetical protein